MNEQLLIRQLKQLPRVGQGGTRRAADQFANSSNTDFIKALNDLTAVVAALGASEVLSLADKTFDKISTNLQNVTQQVDLFNDKLNLNVAAAGQLATNFGKVAQSTQQFQLTSAEVAKGAVNLDNSIRGVGQNMAKVTNETQNAATFVAALETGFNLTAEQATNVAQQGLAFTGNIEKYNTELVSTSVALDKVYNTQDAYARITEQIGKTSALTRGYIGDQTEQLAKAAFMADRLGVSMDAAMIAGKNTLDIESSIAAEMELMALTGRAITDASGNNLVQKMREATATGDIVSLMEAQKDLAENYSDIIQDPLLSNSLANLSGLTEEQLANLNETIKARKASAKIASDQGVPPDNIQRFDINPSQVQVTSQLTGEQAFAVVQEKASITAAENVERLGGFLKGNLDASGLSTKAAVSVNDQSANLRSFIDSTNNVYIEPLLTKFTEALDGFTPNAIDENKLGKATADALKNLEITVIIPGIGQGKGTFTTTTNTINQTGATSGAAGANSAGMGGN